MYESSVPVFIHFLNGLAAILRKTEQHIEARKLDPDAFLKARLFPDMFTFTRQVQIATDNAKGAGARLAGVAVPSFPDEEKTFEELHERIRKTVDFLRSLKKEQFKDAATRRITMKIGGQDTTFAGADYLSNQALPNFYFHLATAYGLLRHNGVELGKREFMGRG